ncbi:predicted protein [Plenodomus lingam JN3]|uniref:Predicted protein n=1 Tax=Leptosphaeria maculans (strain JN3 / isolate v23.1.3 / race Av1-4-5-6-7-8) TaxID=985895 RepID=E4ZNS4_LEPMJ|nr:predicted protein [Plenodomus lingam JN3]CBX93293.1 predicted protein [Plenodomus lingam JN3]
MCKFCCHGCQNRGIVDLDCSHMQASGSSRTEHVLAHWNCSEPRANGPVARRRHYVGKATVASIAYVQHSVTQTAGGSFALLRGGAATTCNVRNGSCISSSFGRVLVFSSKTSKGDTLPVIE